MSAKQLYRVDVSFEIYVMATTEDEARDVAIDNAHDSMWTAGTDFDVCRPATRIDRATGKRRPLGADASDKRTVGEILTDQAKASAA